MSPQPFFDHLLGFTRALQQEGINVTSANVISLCECLALIDLANKNDFYATTRTSLLSHKDHIQVFDKLFSEYWLQQQHPQKKEEIQEIQENIVRKISPHIDQQEYETEQEKTSDNTLLSYSPKETLMKMDFAEMSEHEIAQVRKLIMELVSIIANYQSHRRQATHKSAELNLRKILRHQAFYGSDMIRFEYKKPRIKKTHLFLLCDVSGSMKKYSRFLIQFMFALRQQLSNLDIAVFSTHMTMITDKLAKQSIDASLREVAETVPNWDGGTNLGQSFQELNEHLGCHHHNKQTIMVVLSDGWDRGNPTELRDAMAGISRRVDKLLWLNPLLSHDEYKPLCQGMQTVLPYIDYFLPAHNLESFTYLLQQLRSLWR